MNPADTPRALVEELLRSDLRSWAWPSDDESTARTFLQEAERHHVEALIAWRLQESTCFAEWPECIRRALDDTLRNQTARELLVQRELASVLDAFDSAEVPALLLKGTALAYTLYPAPALRRRNDTDMLIERPDLNRVAFVLAELGYRRENYLAGSRVSHQALFRKTDRHGLRHDLDIHWKISNRPMFEDTLEWRELENGAVAVPALGPHVRALGLIHSLILACLHPVAHHGNARETRLRWIYDVHLLAAAMTEPDFDRWLDLARARRTCAICLQALERARDRLGTAVPRWVTDALREAPDEPSGRYLSAGPWRGDVRLSDLQTTPGVRAKMQLVREVVLPDAAYMREEYGVSSSVLLAPLYVHRAVRGSWRLLLRLVS